jgi:hypothetical protein
MSNNSNLIVIAYSNKENIQSLNYRMSLKKQGYDYKIVGNREIWINYLTKIKAYYKYVSKLKRLKGGGKRKKKYDLVCLTDCHDVIACDSPENLISKYLTFNSDIVFSAEPNCLKEKCIYLKEYWDINKSEKENKFLNSGFIIGKIDTVFEALQFVLDQEQFGITDDQLAYCMYATKHPKKISLDHSSKLCGTIGTNLMDYEVIDNTPVREPKVIYIKSKETPCFIHTPGNSSDFSYRLDHFGKKLYGDDYLTDSIMNKLKNFKNYLKDNKMLKVYGLIVIALLLFFVYHHPKIILLYLLIISIILAILSF